MNNFKCIFLSGVCLLSLLVAQNNPPRFTLIERTDSEQMLPGRAMKIEVKAVDSDDSQVSYSVSNLGHSGITILPDVSQDTTQELTFNLQNPGWVHVLVKVWDDGFGTNTMLINLTNVNKKTRSPYIKAININPQLNYKLGTSAINIEISNAASSGDQCFYFSLMQGQGSFNGTSLFLPDANFVNSGADTIKYTNRIFLMCSNTGSKTRNQSTVTMEIVSTNRVPSPASMEIHVHPEDPVTKNLGLNDPDSGDFSSNIFNLDDYDKCWIDPWNTATDSGSVEVCLSNMTARTLIVTNWDNFETNVFNITVTPTNLGPIATGWVCPASVMEYRYIDLSFSLSDTEGDQVTNTNITFNPSEAGVVQTALGGSGPINIWMTNEGTVWIIVELIDEWGGLALSSNEITVTHDGAEPNLLSVTGLDVLSGHTGRGIVMNFDEQLDGSVLPTIELYYEDGGGTDQLITLTTPGQLVFHSTDKSILSNINFDLSDVGDLEGAGSVIVTGAKDLAGNTAGADAMALTGTHTLIDTYTRAATFNNVQADNGLLSFSMQLAETAHTGTVMLYIYNAPPGANPVLTLPLKYTGTSLSNYAGVNLIDLTAYTGGSHSEIGVPVGSALSDGDYTARLGYQDSFQNDEAVETYPNPFTVSTSGPELHFINSNDYFRILLDADAAHTLPISWQLGAGENYNQIDIKAQVFHDDSGVPQESSLSVPGLSSSEDINFTATAVYYDKAIIRLVASNTITKKYTTKQTGEFFIGNHTTMLCLDNSGSMSLIGDPSSGNNMTKMQALKNAVKCYLDAIYNTSKDRLGIVTFSTTPAEFMAIENIAGLDLGSLKNDIQNNINTLNMTTIFGGISNCYKLLDADGGFAHHQKTILLATDGKHNTAPNIGDLTPHPDVNIFALGIGNDVSPGQIEAAIKLGLPPVEQPNWASRYYAIEETEPGNVTIMNKVMKWFGRQFQTGAGTIIDPPFIATNGTQYTFPVNLNRSQKQVTFLVNWTHPESEFILQLKAPGANGKIIDMNMGDKISSGNFNKEVLYEIGETHCLLRVTLLPDGELAEYWTGEWQMLVKGDKMKQETEEVSYMVFARTAGVFDAGVMDTEIHPGEDALLEVKLGGHFYGLKPVVTAQVDVPLTSLGNVLASQKVSRDELLAFAKEKRLPPELLADKQALKHLYLYYKNDRQELVKYKTIEVTLNDRGKDGDRKSGDGIYSCSLGKNRIPGTYSVILKTFFEGEKYPTARELALSINSKMKLSPDRTRFWTELLRPELQKKLIEELRKQGSLTTKAKRMLPTSFLQKLTIRPQDEYNNRMSLDRAQRIKLYLSHGERLGDLIDNQDGTFSLYVLTYNQHKDRDLGLTLSDSGVSIKVGSGQADDGSGNKLIWFVLFILLLIIVLYLIRKRKRD